MDIESWKKRKKELHWTHDDLAKASGVSRRTIARIFSGNPDCPSPTINTVEAIERALGLNEKNPTVRDAQSDIAENFVKEFGDLFSDETFVKYARLYKMMNAAQRLMILGVIIGHLENAGISVPPMLR